MAVPGVDVVLEERHHSIRLITWALTPADTNLRPVTVPGYSDKTVHVYGTWGTGVIIVMQGSNETESEGFTNSFNLKDATGTPISLTSSAPGSIILESPYQLRPALTAGTGYSLTIRLLCRAQRIR